MSDRDVPNENDSIPPNIMWPEKGSGFEPDPFSPAGSAQRQWWLINATRGRGRRTRMLGWFAVALIAIPLAIGLVVRLIHLLP